MAFAGMFLGFIFLCVVACVFVAVIAMLVIATILMVKKKRKTATVLYVIASIPIVISIVLGIVLVCINVFPTYETYDGGKVVIFTGDISHMKTLIGDGKYKDLDEWLDKHPELIYYLDHNQCGLIDFALYNCDVRLMEIALSHGAKFDDSRRYDRLVYNASLQTFYYNLGYSGFVGGRYHHEDKYTSGVTTYEMIEAVKFAVDHGAAVKWEPSAFSDKSHKETLFVVTSHWIDEDGKISDCDREMLEYAESVS